MAMPTFTMRQLLEAGVHFGHHTRRWNPKMKPYLFGVRNGVHIIDLTKTVPLLEQALLQVRQVVSNGGRVLFVGTKAAAAERVADAARRCGQYYVNHRWLGGMMTNWQTISASIKRLSRLPSSGSSGRACGSANPFRFSSPSSSRSRFDKSDPRAQKKGPRSVSLAGRRASG